MAELFFFPGVKPENNPQPQAPTSRVERELGNGLFLYSEETSDFGGFRSCGVCDATGWHITTPVYTPDVRILTGYGLIIVQTVAAHRNRFQLIDRYTGNQLEASFADYKIFGKWIVAKTVIDDSLKSWSVFNLKTRTTVFSVLRPTKK